MHCIPSQPSAQAWRRFWGRLPDPAVARRGKTPFEIETLDLAAPLADEVLVRVVASGMCHTDLHAGDGYFQNLPYPVVCGHEGAGIIEQVRADVADLAPVSRRAHLVL